MLEPWIIDEIRRREENERRGGDRPQLELPVPDMRDDDHPANDAGDHPNRDADPKRGVVIIAM